MLNIQSVIEDRYPSFLGRSRLIKRPILAMLRLLFHEREFQQFGERYPHVQGVDFIEEVFNYFDFSYSVRHNERERIPVSGKLVIIANHPIGTLDGLALLKLVSEIRSDVKVIGNDLLMTINPIQSLVLPVNNMGGGTASSKLKAIHEHLNNEGALIVFPAGEVSRMSPAGVRDGKWRSGFLRIAEATQSPILPVYVDAKNSLFFYSLSLLSRPLSTLWLIRETFKHAKNSVAIRIGEQVQPSVYQELKIPLKAKASLFKKQVYRIGKGKSSLFKTEKAIAHPENRQLLRQEISQCELLGETKDNKKIYLYTHKPNACLMREIGRLREIAFRVVGEGTGDRRDLDQFDQRYFHIVLWDAEELEVVGAYRLCNTHKALKDSAKNRIYSSTLFDLQPSIAPITKQGLELGRSFVQPKYWGTRSLEYLWYGISAFLNRNPQYRYLIGPVSISNTYSKVAQDTLVYYYKHYYGCNKSFVLAKNPYTIDEQSTERLESLFADLNTKDAFMRMKNQLSHMGYSVPTLYKQYSELCEPGGVQFLDFNIDPDFADCIDGLVVVDIDKIKDIKRKRYNLKPRKPHTGPQTEEIADPVR
ncbi:GNAT family N-acyltransferase [Alkalimarinus coralli]|uniref:GNAT family N-acyltransferase n=1 Tax=Alkalimarinus coralli TaxID=2935863 RepID=UPI00202B8891|nr:lysophospholipid acyltransferase family protein [Alkalimarinus coralli]